MIGLSFFSKLCFLKYKKHKNLEKKNAISEFIAIPFNMAFVSCI